MSVWEEPVHLEEYDPQWPIRFSLEASTLEGIFRGRPRLQIAHFGSTSVPGLRAKPVIDILVGVEEMILQPEELDSVIRAGYEVMAGDSVPGRIHLRKRTSDSSANANLVLLNGALWTDNLRLRNYLRSHPDLAQRYAEVKQAAAEAHPDSLLSYSAAKADFIQDLLQRVRGWGGDEEEA